jgi:hypothetical protein
MKKPLAKEGKGNDTGVMAGIKKAIQKTPGYYF